MAPKLRRSHTPTLDDHFRQGGSRKVNLILGPGAARGFMHVGVLRALIDEGYEIRSIIGSSAGAFIALMYARTHDVDQVERLISGIGFREIFQPKGKRLTVASLRLNRAAITRYFVQLFGREDVTFEELDMPLAFTATNLLTGKVEFIHSGAILPALLASATLPFINPPEHIDGIPYIDGGLTLNMPRFIPASVKRGEPYLGVNVAYGRRFRNNQVDLWRHAIVWLLQIWQRLRHTHHTTESFAQAHERLVPVKLHSITIEAPDINRGDFDKFHQAVKLGYQAVASQMPAVNVTYEPRSVPGPLILHTARV